MGRRLDALKAVFGGATKVVRAQYDAAGNGRRMRAFNPPSSGPRGALKGLQKIRDRARDVSRNDWSGKSGLQKWTTNLIGTGIVPRLTKGSSATLKAKVTDLWDAWVKVADADGVLDFYGLQTLATRAWLESGEVFIRLRQRSIDTGLVVPFQVQLIEAEYVPLLDADSWPGLPAGNVIRSGIELNKYGRRMAYWMWKSHPAEITNGILDPQFLIRVPASQVRHMFEPERPGQLRGVSMLAPVIARLREINDYDDAVQLRQKIANLFTVFFTRPAPDINDSGVDPMTGAPIETGADGSQMAELLPGMSMELDPGTDVKFANPPEAGTTYSDYMRTQHLATSAGAGLPYELYSGDILNISDRTLRIVINEFRRLAKQRQWQIIIPMFCAPVRDEWANQAYVAGSLTQAEADTAKRVEWSPHGWEYIHPVQDATGKALEVTSGFRSRASVVGERGDDIEAVDAERADDAAREKRLGLVPPPAPATPPGNAPKKPAPPNALERAQIALMEAQALATAREPEPAGPSALEQGLAAMAALVKQSQEDQAAIMSQFLEHANALAARPQNTYVAAPAVSIENTTHVEPTPVSIENTTHVEPTPVIVQNDVVNNVTAQAGETNVVVALPNRKTETTFKHNADGDVVKATQIETTIEDPK